MILRNHLLQFSFTLLSIIFLANLSFAATSEGMSDEVYQSILDGSVTPKKAEDEKNTNEKLSTVPIEFMFSQYGIEKNEVKKSFQPILSDWAEYRKFKFNNYIRVFTLQYWMSIIIFVMVIFLVSFGCFLSFKHFQRDKDGENHQLSIGKDGVKISSPVIGLMILLISFIFFYSYLINVYKINVLP